MNFNSTIQSWSNVLIHPGEAAMDEERAQPQATLTTAIVWVVIAAIVTGVLGWLRLQQLFGTGNEFSLMLEQMDLPPELAQQMEELMTDETFAMLLGGSGLMTILITPLFFLLGVGILHLIARLFGGSGEFGPFAYLVAAIHAPIDILSAVLGFIPVLGGCGAFALSIYSLVLTFFAIKSAHRLSDGRALGTLLAIVVLVLFFFACAAAALVGMFFSVQPNL